MHRHGYYSRPISRIVTGLVLIGMGLVFLLARYDIIQMHTIERFWPLAVIVIGIGRLLSWRTRPLGFGVMMVLAGAWFLMITNNVYGLTWHTGWPVIIIIVGIAVVVEAVAYRHFTPLPDRGDDDV